jgi:hypothetical protein
MSLPTREPVVIRTAVVGILTALLHALVVLGVVPIDADQEQAAAGIIDVVGMVVAALWSRAAVTPVAGLDESEAWADAEAGAPVEEPVEPAEGYVPEHAAP